MGLTAKLPVRGGYAWSASGSPLTAAEQIALAFTLTDGTGAGQANCVYKKSIDLAATTYLDIDLKGGNGELDVRNTAMAMTAVKAVLLAIDTPASGTSLRFGPQGRTNAAQLWFQADTTNFYDVVLDTLVMRDARAGWTLDNTHKVVSLYNPGAGAVTGTLWIFGTK